MRHCGVLDVACWKWVCKSWRGRSRCDEIGKHIGLRNRGLMTCGFESHHLYQKWRYSLTDRTINFGLIGVGSIPATSTKSDQL